jgi:AraC family transcriptional regulator
MLSYSHSDQRLLSRLVDNPTTPRSRSVDLEPANRTVASGARTTAAAGPLVSITPQHAVARRAEAWSGIAAEIVRTTSKEPIEYRFKAPVHLLIVYERGVRQDGETFIENLPRSTLQDVSHKLTVVPAGHEYRESLHPRIPTSQMYVYVDPAAALLDDERVSPDRPLQPRLFFEDANLWCTAIKLKRALEAAETGCQLYAEALGTVIAHELTQAGRSAGRKNEFVRGGLASWQQRVVTTYIEDHLAESISLATLADMARLSSYYFCRAFKQSLGMPPHRYHMSRRIERAKALLTERGHSVTEIGLSLGYSDTSSFTAAFRRTTGMTPRDYSRSLM